MVIPMWLAKGIAWIGILFLLVGLLGLVLGALGIQLLDERWPNYVALAGGWAMKWFGEALDEE